MTTTAVDWPDEDRYDPPAELMRWALPRRGRPWPRQEITPDLLARAEALLAEAELGVVAGLASPRTDPELRDAGTGQLRGAPSPLGAAVVYHLAVRRRGLGSEASLAVLADQWVARWGLAFAVEALMALTDLTARGKHQSDNHVEYWIERGGRQDLRTWCGEPVADRLRDSMASADEEEHARAIEVLAGLRDTPRRQAIAAYLAPAERHWVAQARLAPRGGPDTLEIRMVLGTVETLAEAVAMVGRNAPWGYSLRQVSVSPAALPTLVEQVGPEIAPLLEWWLGADGGPMDGVLLGHLASFPTDEAVAVLARRAAQRGVVPFLREALRRFPRRGARVLADVIAARTDAAIEETLLAAHLLAWPGVADVAEMSARGRAVVDRLLATTTARLPVADLADLPPVLVDPPWTRERTKVKSVVVAGLTPLGADAVVWAEGERQRWVDSAARSERPYEVVGDVDWGALFRQYGGATDSDHWLTMPMMALGPEEDACGLLRRWRPEHLTSVDGWGRAIVGRFGLDALDAFLHVAGTQPALAAPCLLPFTGPRVARVMADWAARRKAVRGKALAWFARHGADGIRPLVPGALAKAGKARTAAEGALRLVAQRAGDDAVLAVAREYGPDAEAGVRALLAADSLNVLPAKLPAIGDWANPALLPRLALADGRSAVPAEQVGHLLTILALGKPGEPYAGLAQVKAATDPASLARFGWRLFCLWMIDGYAAEDGWVLTALGAVGDDEVVRGLSPLIRAWPGDGGHQRAVAGLDVLAEIGTDVALMHLNGIANKVKFKGLKTKAVEKVAAVADGLGRTGEQLADRLVPDLGLDANGAMVLDYGPRKFTVGFDEQLKPFVTDEDGVPRKVLPKPGANDDQDLAPQAYKLFAGLKKDVKTVATDQVRRLQRAMVTGRRWSAHEFTELFATHPLLWHLVRRLVWGVYTGSGALTASFRLAEDRTLADADDTAFTLPDDSSVGVAHPLHLGESVDRWGELFADYEILQPFPQLGREVHALTEDDRHSRRLTRFEGVTVPTGRVLGLVHRGWERNSGMARRVTKHVGPDRVLVVALDPGISAGYMDNDPEMTIERVWLAGDTGGRYRAGEDDGHTFDGLDPVAASEFLADLTALTGERALRGNGRA
ncbi:DUF4132 domain-containing protein [Actinokineospora pegani]|uniref:DUF4132 domain-containing protein n=1 Tax=Actinokineospora pegani TaxID=2654637 RepID=UPI0012EA1C15|nr:DUF4132 domain-containing protein [Actinokineospora pegani]